MNKKRNVKCQRNSTTATTKMSVQLQKKNNIMGFLWTC